MTAYSGERILASATDNQTDRLKFYKEPDVEAVGPLDKVVLEGKVAVQKLIFMAEQSE